MSAAEALITVGEAVGTLIAKAFLAEEQREAAIDALVADMKPTPPHAAPNYQKNREKLLGDADELPKVATLSDDDVTSDRDPDTEPPKNVA
jgi:hypothetical protein